MVKRTLNTPQIPSFYFKELSNITFGDLEGEKDKLLKEAFFSTKSIAELLKGRYNYILSPKGGGKSAIFRAYEEKLFPFNNNLFDYNKHNIISINEAFGFESEYLDREKFREQDHQKNYTISWAIYLLVEILKDIQKYHKEKKGYSQLMSKIRRVDELKTQFRLYNVTDFISQFDATLAFTANGQQMTVTPKLKLHTAKEKLNVNEVFKDINSFYQKNNLQALILIDRIDLFVRREKSEIQKNYLQGLIDCIEELSTLSNLQIMLFVRTDLFYAFEIKFEYDKVRERVLYLGWDIIEVTNFVTFRLLANKYIRDNYFSYFKTTIVNGLLEHLNQSKYKSWVFFVKPILHFFNYLKDLDKENFEEYRDRVVTQELEEIRAEAVDYPMSYNFIYLFLPSIVPQVYTGREVEVDFISWLTTSFRDANKFLNPRSLIYFFNELIKIQVSLNRDPKKIIQREAKAIFGPEIHRFNIFSIEAIFKTFEQVRESELRHIESQLKRLQVSR